MAFKYRWILLICLSCMLNLPDCLNLTAISFLPKAYAQADRGLRLHVDVELTTLEVVALDENDNPIRNLKKEDFLLFEDEKKQEIISLDAVMAESEVPSLGANLLDARALHQGKTVFIIFDDTSISPQNIKASRDSARKFVQKHMRPQDVFAVASHGMSMNILQNFTSEQEAVLRAIGQPAASNAGGGSLYLENLLRVLESISQSIAPIRGKKSILIYSQSSLAPVSVSNLPLSGARLSQMDRDMSASGTLDKTYKAALEAALKHNVAFYTVDPGALNSSGSSPGISLRSLAAESGGYSILDTNDIDGGLDALDRQLSNYYILGYQSSRSKGNGIFRKLEVKTGMKGVSLRYRKRYIEQRPPDSLSGENKEKILLEALASPEAAAQLPISFRPLYFYDSTQKARVLVAARIQLANAKFRKAGKRVGTNINVMGVAYSENGAIAARFSETVPLLFDKEKEAAARRTGVGYRNYLRLSPGKYRVKLAVSDEANALGTIEHSLLIPEMTEKRLAVSSLVIAEQSSRLSELIRDLQTQMLDENNPLIYSGMEIEPSVEHRLAAGAPLPILFRIYNLPEPLTDELTAKVTLWSANKEVSQFPPISLNRRISFTNRGEGVVGLGLGFPKILPGKYRLVLEITQPASTEAVMIETDIECSR